MFTRILSFLSPALTLIAVLPASLTLLASIEDGRSHYLLSADTAPRETVQDVRPLSPGEWVERKIATNETHFYRTELKTGEAMEVDLIPVDVGVQTTVWGPDQTKFAAPYSEHPSAADDVYHALFPVGDWVRDRLVVVAKKDGAYHVRIDGDDSEGSYKLRVTRRPATNNDQKYAEIVRLGYEIRAFVLGLRSEESILGHYDKIISLLEEMNDTPRVAMYTSGRSYSEASRGEYTAAIASGAEARELFAKAGRRKEAANATRCDVFEYLGDFQSSIACYQEKFHLAREAGDVGLEAGTLTNIGVVYHRLADEDKADHFYKEALKLLRSRTERDNDSWWSEMLLFTNLGNLARGMNGGEVPIEFFPTRTKEDYERALPFLLKAVELSEKYKFGFVQFNYRQVANTYAELERYDEAIEYFQRSIKLNTQGNQTMSLALAKKELARVLIRQGKKDEGTDLLEEVLPVLKSNLSSLHDIAIWHHKAGRTERAKELLKDSLVLAKERQLAPFQARVYHSSALIERDLGNFDNARKDILQAISISDELRNHITSDEIRSVYFAAVKKYYDFYIDLLMQAHKAQPEKQYDRLALEISERARSRNLVDLLRLSGVDIREGVDPELLAKEKDLRARLAAKAAFHGRLMLSRPKPEEAEKAQAEVNEAAEVLARVEADIRKVSPRYAAVTQPSALTVKQMQEMLDSGTLILQYFLGERKSYGWVVSPETVHSFDLPPRAEIESEARGVYAAVTARNALIEESSAERSARLRKADLDYRARSSRLTEMVLAPAWNHIKNKRLAIVPDGALHYISFAALPSLTGASLGTAQPRLAQTNEIITLPSVSAIARLREELSGRTPAQKVLAVFADPVFTITDSRNARRSGGPAKRDRVGGTVALRDLDLALLGAGLSVGELPRLLFSRREADAIAASLPGKLALKQMDFQATKDSVFSSDLDEYRIVHFATHGLLDSRHPGLSGMVLSLVDQRGNDIDGFLRLQDVYNLKLNADLVVLSACSTALGKEVRGEGLVGLTRGFMYAGSPRVVASLWKVDDAATAAFMTIFYKKMLAENMRPAAALRAAQLEMMKQRRWRSPYYWAPFVLQGEWR